MFPWRSILLVVVCTALLPTTARGAPATRDVNGDGLQAAIVNGAQPMVPDPS